MISEQLIEQLENYIAKNFIDFEALKKKGWHFSYSETKKEIGTSEKIIRKLKDVLGMSGNYF